MKNHLRLAVLGIIASLFCHGLVFPQTWTQRAPIPTERWNPTSVVLDGSIYVIGGQKGISPYEALSTVEVYDPTSNTWEAKEPMPTPRWGVVAAVVDERIYAIGGRGGSFEGGHYALDVVEEYDPNTDTWISKTSMPTSRGWAGGAVIDDTIFVFGGRGIDTEETVVEKYHPATDSWTAEQPMPKLQGTSFMTAPFNNKVYFFGGWGSNLVQEYDPASKMWTTKNPMPTPRGGSGIGTVHDRIYIVGGRGGNSNELESYDPVHDRWTSWTPMPTRREGLTAAVAQNKLYAITGSVPLAEGGIPYVNTNEEVSDLTRPILEVEGYKIDDSQGNRNGAFNTGESIDFIVSLENIGYTGTAISVELRIADENIIMIESDALYGQIEPFQPTDNSEDPFRLAAYPDFEAHWTTATLFVSADGDYEDTLSLDFPVGNAFTLVIDDDGGSKCEDYYHTCLYSKGKVYNLWEMKSRGCPCFDLSEYETIIWFTGAARDSTLTQDEQNLLFQYLDTGGHLILSGQNIGFDLVANGSENDSLFFVNYLHADFLGDSADETFLHGIEEDPVSNEFTFLPIDESQTSPDVISPCGGASPVLVYYSSGHTAAIKYEGDYKLVYFALGLEGINAMDNREDDEVRGTLLNNIIEWFNYVPKKGDVNQDSRINIMDVLMTVNIVLGVVEPTPSQNWAADCNEDAIMNIMDVIGIVNVVLGIGTCPPTGATKITPSVVEYLQSLTTHLSPDDVARLMALVTKVEAPAEYHLSQNYPNPFNPVTSIEFALPWTTETNLSIYNIMGQKVEVLIDDQIKAGYHRLEWDASEMASGIYFCRLTAGHFTETKRMILMK